MSTADRGKVAEGLLDKEFRKLDLSLANFTFERIYDARSSRGAMANPRVGDFVLYHNGLNIVVECKETEHAYRLPVGNFELDQRARARKRQIAGAICVVVVYHSTTEKWRLEPLDFFGTLNKGSWDFRGRAEYTKAQIIEKLIALGNVVLDCRPLMVRDFQFTAAHRGWYGLAINLVFKEVDISKVNAQLMALRATELSSLQLILK